MLVRLRVFAIVWLIALDQLLAVTIFGLNFLLFKGDRPNPDETLSSHIGRASIAGHRWARISERLVDGLFQALGTGPGHCRASIEWDEI